MKKMCTRALAALLLAALLTALAPATLAALPEPAEKQADVVVYRNGKAKVDASNAAEGYVTVSYLGGRDVRIKVRVTKLDGIQYTYDLNNKGDPEVFPLTEGDGSYTVTVYENVVDNRYSQAYSCSIAVKLRNPFLPFLYPNQHVNYTTETKCVVKAAELTADLTDQLKMVEAVYHFVVGHLSYDKALAASVQSGYLPVLDSIYDKQTGICFDYASMMAAMLRSRGIPCKLVFGYAGDAYHAWINVYIEGKGWLDALIYFDGVNWSLVDPTFASTAGANSSQLKEYVGDGSAYVSKYAY
ncbi:MAG: transglutaminase domain-containing protein [Clostridiales bacterium]|nr:transglutaminase domain-containing protein [Clostridiales bacterium]